MCVLCSDDTCLTTDGCTHTCKKCNGRLPGALIGPTRRCSCVLDPQQRVHETFARLFAAADFSARGYTDKK